MAKQTEMLSQLTALVGDLQPTSTASAADLAHVRRLAADAIRSTSQGIAATAAVLPGGVEVAELGRLLEEPAQPAQVLVSRRELPIFSTQLAGSVPAWASGRAVDRSVGPFRDRLGRPIWIDVYRIVKHVRLVRRAGGAPFLLLPVSVVVLHGHPSTSATYDVPAGSVWIASHLLASAAPASSFTGLRIRSGRLQLTQPIAITNDEIIVPSAVQIDLDLELDPEVAPAGSGDGADARAAQCETPRSARLHVDAARATFPLVGKSRVQAYGSVADLSQHAGVIEYLPELNRLAVPMACDAPTFEVRHVASRVFVPAGRARITRAAWGLPVAVIDPAHLGDASGSGNLLLSLAHGLHATWAQQSTPVALGPAILMVDPARLAIVASTASGVGAQQRLELWAATTASVLRYTRSFPLRFFSQAVGSEVLSVTAGLDATMDRPVDVKGERLTVRAASAQVIVLAGPQGLFAVVTGHLDVPAGVSRIGLALKNALLLVAPPEQLLLYVGLDAVHRGTGACLLVFRQRAIVPTLPDPYAANLGGLRALLDQPGARLISVVSWRPDHEAQLDFEIQDNLRMPEGSGANAGPSVFAPSGSAESTLVLARAALVAGPRSSGVADALGNALAFERLNPLILVDVSTNVDQFGIALVTKRDSRSSSSIAVRDLYLQSQDMLLLTLPAVQWEAVITESDPNDPTFPRRLGFDTSGIPTVISVPSAHLVSVAPRAALDALIQNFELADPRPADARFTLPFGMVASAVLDTPRPTTPSGASLEYNRPKTPDLEGGHQISIRAVDPSLPAGASPSLRGYTAQLAVGQPGNRSVLGDQVTILFNDYLGASGTRPLVPVTRLDLSGYGESLFSDWRNPFPDAVAVSQARFDVLVGRTAHEVVQVRSLLYPYAVQVVRTITIQRKNNAVVSRRDSGWQAVSDGVYVFDPTQHIETHPGVVRRVTNVKNIHDTGEIQTIDGLELAAVRFDADIEIDGAAGLVPARAQLGYVQLSTSTLTATTYQKLVESAGALGGPIDASLKIGGGGHAMRVRRVGVGVTQGMGGPEFVMTAWGSPAFPGGGEWSFLRLTDPALAPTSVPKDGVPLIRGGAASSGAPPLSSPYRFADPIDLAQPTNPESDYGVLHATGTQRAFFPRPKIEATDTKRITSTRIPVLADTYGLATSLGLFPELSRGIPFPSATWALLARTDGSFHLELPSSTFPVTVGRRTLQQAGSVKGDVDYTGATVTYEVDTAQPVPWRFELIGARKVMNSSLLGDVITVGANVRASAGVATTFTEPRLQLGGSLSVVQDLLTILADLGIAGIMSVAMTNEWSLKIALKVPFKTADGEDLQIPPLVPTPDIKFSDTGVEVEVKVWPTADEASFKLGGKPMFAIKSIPGLYAVAIIEFEIKLSTTTGTTYALTLGVGIAYSISAGPFELTGLFGITIFGFIGDTTIGFGVGFLVQVSVELAIIEIQISLEGKLALVWACRGEVDETLYGAAKLKFATEITICFVFSISFEFETTASKVLRGPGTCALPDVIP